MRGESVCEEIVFHRECVRGLRVSKSSSVHHVREAASGCVRVWEECVSGRSCV